MQQQQPKMSRSRVVALAVIPAVASSVGTYAVTRATCANSRPAQPARVVAVADAATVAPVNLDDYAYPGARRRGMTRVADLESREYDTDAPAGRVAQHYRQRIAPDVRADYARAPASGSFSAMRSMPYGGRFSASGRVQIDAKGSGTAIFFRRDAAGTLTVVVAGHAGEKTTVVTTFAAADR